MAEPPCENSNNNRPSKSSPALDARREPDRVKGA
ncbi:unnamed protein product [Acanthoscelides obtectus]|uniref:Uncharacterized protein n=1 Tax=Acanthoscelides obtectus TaxID=200917 RepID=A0A9P0KFD7_ACAOB|nr:unnamed protein product [Acanthoscelides obtectus]CAK1669300.1 hypothetical protein AOBTE_LOCUS26941 [Acanthoscelides obtectus]